MASDATSSWPPAVSGAPHPRPELDGWVRRHGTALRRYFARRVSEAEAEDLVQEVFLRLHAMGRDAPIENIDRFIFTVARNILISRHRYHRSRHAGAHEPLSATSDPVDPLSPERIVIGAAEYERIVAAILALPPRARAAFQFHRFEHMTYQQIADRMGISHQSVKELIQRALVRLAEHMDDGT
ncbi:RNA polymerase sigma factor [Sphingomonas hylomeconis]|uniref:RNA polymerase sigma factor n=1 Tax=Sphingomonas hylomeconis TaxID=1395958 RepID=A0ABV7SU76_9SPHN|nr:sigma-70 family RNA polymerase sigma factor [Sphingomonas hylomeconis]